MLQRSHQPFAKKSPTGTSIEGRSSLSQKKRNTSRRQYAGATVSQICWIAPGPSISARTPVALPAISMLGEIFQPCPSSRAELAPVPSVAFPPSPFAPVKFSALIERVCADDNRDKFPRLIPRPLNESDIVWLHIFERARLARRLPASLKAGAKTTKVL